MFIGVSRLFLLLVVTIVWGESGDKTYWICTLEQAEVYVKAVESFMEEMKSSEHARSDRSMHRPYSGEYERESRIAIQQICVD